MRLIRIPGPGRFSCVTPDTTLPQYDGDTYPESTSVLCWHCCHGFEGRPIPLPLSYSHARDAYRVMGVFCSIGCMVAYSRDNRAILPGASNGSIGMTIFQFVKQWTGNSDPRAVQRAPPRCLLMAFGGSMTLEEFRAGGECDIVSMPPRCILQEQVLYERQRSMSHTHVSASWASTRSGAASDVTTSGETLKLKRKHQHKDPPKAKRTILEQALGL